MAMAMKTMARPITAMVSLNLCMKNPFRSRGPRLYL